MFILTNPSYLLRVLEPQFIPIFMMVIANKNWDDGNSKFTIDSFSTTFLVDKTVFNLFGCGESLTKHPLFRRIFDSVMDMV